MMTVQVQDAIKNRSRELPTVEEIKELNDTYFRLFNTDDGKAVLNHLIDITICVPVAHKGDNLLDIGEKQGRVNLVHEILQRINNAREGL